MNPSTTDRLLLGKEVAPLIGWTPETFSRHKQRLIREEAFPAPLPSGRYWLSSVLRWLDTYGERKSAAIASAQNKSIASVRVHSDRASLEAKYVGSNAA